MGTDGPRGACFAGDRTVVGRMTYPALGGNHLCYRMIMKAMDWRECAAIETVPGKMSGQPVVIGSRVRPEDLVINRDQGTEWLARNHGLSVDTVRDVLAFYERHMRTRAPAV